MNGQLLITVVLICLAGTYLLFSVWRVWRSLRGGACAGGCGCAKATKPAEEKRRILIPSEQLVLRQRPPRSDA